MEEYASAAKCHACEVSRRNSFYFKGVHCALAPDVYILYRCHGLTGEQRSLLTKDQVVQVQLRESSACGIREVEKVPGQWTELRASV